MGCLILSLMLALALLKVSAAQLHPEVVAVPKPPIISVQPDRTVYFNPQSNDSVYLPCEANSSFPVTYAWTKNGQPFCVDRGVDQLPNVGTLVFSKPLSWDRGYYQCWATNAYGTAVSYKVLMREAMLGEDLGLPERTYRPQVGDSLTLNCLPPQSIPRPQVVWVLVGSDGEWELVQLDNRVTMDQEFRLRFVNVLGDDYQGGKGYACMTLNSFLRKSVRSNLYFIQPQGDVAPAHPPEYMWSSHSDVLALRGSELVLKCIFSGNPTPQVQWERKYGAPLPPTAQIRDSGMELVISSVQFSDSGGYNCVAVNSQIQTPVRRSIEVAVQASPYWVQVPGEVEGRVGASAEFHCDAAGVPQPYFRWYINGVTLEDVTDSMISRVTNPAPDRLVISGLTSQDAMAVQCNATNRNGHVFGQFSLYVIDVPVPKPPIISVQPDRTVYFNPQSNDSVYLPCEANSSFPVTYAWTRNGISFPPENSVNQSVVQLPNAGTLVFQGPRSEDIGRYQCWARNDYGVSVSYKVLLSEALLEDFPARSDVTYTPHVGDPLTLRCIPPRSIPQPHVVWGLFDSDGRWEEVQLDDRVTMDHEFRLRFVNVRADDSRLGKGYACVTLNSVIRKMVTSNLHFISPEGQAARTHPAEYMWSSPSYFYGLRGKEFVLQCIFSGNPAPTVQWERENGTDLPTTAQISDSGMELVISSLQFSDAGWYTCAGTNNLTQTQVMRSIRVTVEASPYWVQEPGEVEGRVGASAEFHCDAAGDPQPTFRWYINGVTLADVTDPRISRVTNPAPDRLVISCLTSQDAMAVQCNATNRHGHVFGQFSLYVID